MKRILLSILICLNFTFANDNFSKEIKESIKKIIINGKNENTIDYPAGMPGGWITENKDIEEVSNYLLNGMEGKAPLSYSVCSACHGEDGKGLDYVAPNIQFYSQRLLWEFSGKQGNVESQYNLGVMYLYGEEVKQNLDKAFYYLSLAAKKEFVPAYINLGIMYSKGIGVNKDLKKSFDFYEKASKKGNLHGQYNLGIMYLEGKGVEQNYKKAVEYFSLAVKQGLADAYINLGIMYEQGMGVDKNIKEAKELYKKACDNGINNGCEYYKELNSIVQ